MLTQDEMIGLQAEKHELVKLSQFDSKEEFILHLIHEAAYNYAAMTSIGKNVLDLGCNTGYGSNIINKKCKSISGVDVSENAITFALREFSNNGIDFKVVNGKNLPFHDNQFDMITSFQVIEHIVDCSNFIAELKRVLSPNGFVIFTTPNSCIRLDPGMKPWNTFHVKEYTANEIERLLSEFFVNVKVLGLFATEEITTIEKNRVFSARNNCRLRNSGVKQEMPLFQKIDSVMPYRIKIFLKKIHKSIVTNKQVVELQKKYTWRDLCYSDKNLDQSLDLMVICSNEEINYVVDEITK
ncbi:MAG: class I SAM-dependent methyltransferase [Methylomonas sp.]|jgi:2-polyprenyl-3-methyl-5-hydroxy-6-metoxy-1,4-benzoquinol methylase|uniref:class I SAM-dependent methyltransferase n=1 Tax=Methylomonas sp. TaxID=418 RepID=UPI0025FD1F75|nr:class I SAM-dependent methyltransferase [Methylomonas sp.]MCK9606074.1 class I SAM-dependent methyltransferase [Methylomonas sp.]